MGTRRRRLLARALLLAAGPLAFACSSASAPPPVLGGCTSDAGHCNAVGGSGGGGATSSGGGSGGGSGGSSSDDGGVGVCSEPTSASQCNQCIGGKCCGELQTCTNDTNCEALLGCLSACGGGPSCTSTCEQKYMSAKALYGELTTCATTDCPICAQLGVGDPCAGTTGACQTGLTCINEWCTKTCLMDTDCAGIGPNGGNLTGQPGACRHLSTGNYCFPGCASDTDCIDFAGTSCIVVTDLANANVSVCAAGADAGL
jgi:hypothetical protein